MGRKILGGHALKLSTWSVNEASLVVAARTSGVEMALRVVYLEARGPALSSVSPNQSLDCSSSPGKGHNSGQRSSLQLRAVSRKELMGAISNQHPAAGSCMGTWSRPHSSIFQNVPLRIGFSFSATKETINVVPIS